MLEACPIKNDIHAEEEGFFRKYTNERKEEEHVYDGEKSIEWHRKR